MKQSTQVREGFALPAAILVIGLLSISIAAGFTLINSERRGVDDQQAQVSAFVLAASATGASAADLYLAPDGTNTVDCSDPDAPCGDWTMIDNTSSAGDVVHFAAGDYTYLDNFPAGFAITRPMTILGPQAGVPAPGRTGPDCAEPVGRD